MDLLNKRVLEQWSCNGFESNWLRHFNRKGKFFYFSDSNYTLNRSEKKDDYRYSVIKKCATKVYLKDGNICRSVGGRANTEGTMTYTIVDDVQSLLCKYSFSELFETDLTNILPPDSSKVRQIERNKKFWAEKNIPSNIDFNTYASDMYEEKKEDTKFIEYLRVFFNRQKILHIFDYYDEREQDMSIIQKSMINMHVNHFGDFAEVIDFKTNKNNRTIGFWLFDDCLVYADQSGKSTW